MISIKDKFWFGESAIDTTPTGEKITYRLICLATSQIDELFAVITASSYPANVGNIIMLPPQGKPNNAPASLTDMLVAGLEGETKQRAELCRMLFYLDFLYTARSEMMVRWPMLNIQISQQKQLEAMLDILRSDLDLPQSGVINEVSKKLLRAKDRLGRPDLRTTNTMIKTVLSQLFTLLLLDEKNAGPMYQHRLLAFTIMHHYVLEIEDSMKLPAACTPESRASKLQMQISQMAINPLLPAGLYCQRKFGDELDHPLITPRVSEVSVAEIQLVAIDELLKGLEYSPGDHRENLKRVHELLLMLPNEKPYRELFLELTETVTELNKFFMREPETVKTLAGKMRDKIRNRHKSHPDGPWLIKAELSPWP